MTISNALVGDAYCNSIAWETLESLVDIGNRMAGQDGEREAADLMAETFEQAGLAEISRTEFEIPGWWREESMLSVERYDRQYTDPHQLVALPGTPATDGASAEIVDVGHGTPEEFEQTDVDGKLVLASSKTPDSYDGWIHRREKYHAAADGGAVGFLFRNHVPGCLPPTGGVADEDGPGPIPAVGLSRELGHRLVRYCKRETVPGTLTIDCHNEQTSSQNVSARVGPDTDRRLLVTAHYDAHDIAEGAADNGAGSALVAEIGRLLAGMSDLEIGIECVTFGAEEMGLRGSNWMASQRDLEEILAVINLDGIGSSRDLRVDTHGFDGLADAFEAAGESLQTPVEVTSEFVPHSDHWPFVREGVPGVMAQSASDSDGRGWGHTHADTLDKLDRRDFRDLAVVLTAGVRTISTREWGIEAVDRETITARASEHGIDLD